MSSLTTAVSVLLKPNLSPCKHLYLTKTSSWSRANFIYSSQPEAYTNDFNTNVVGTSIVIQALVPLLRKRDTRRIINISSIMGSMECSTESFNPSVSKRRSYHAGLVVLIHIYLIVVPRLQSCC